MLLQSPSVKSPPSARIRTHWDNTKQTWYVFDELNLFVETPYKEMLKLKEGLFVILLLREWYFNITVTQISYINHILFASKMFVWEPLHIISLSQFQTRSKSCNKSKCFFFSGTDEQRKNCVKVIMLIEIAWF